jgi:hypothetical protein
MFKYRAGVLHVVGEMPDAMTDEEQLAAEWLMSRGYDPEFQSKIVTKGRSPDFLGRRSADPNALWAEVKTLEPESVSIVMGRAWEIIKASVLPADLRGFATLWVNGGTRDQSVHSLLKLFSEHAEKHRAENVRLIFIQQNADTGGIRRVDFSNTVPPNRLWIRGAGDQLAAVPPGVLEDSFAIGTINERGILRSSEAFKLFDWQAPLDCALVATLNPTDHPFSIHPMGGGFVSVAPRILNALESANGQIRNACDYLPAPGVVLIVPPEYGPIDNQQIGAAAYGKLVFSVSVPDGRAGRLQHGPDAAFQSKKNRHISAAIRLYRNGSAGMYFPNRFAHHQISAGAPLLAGLECYPPAAA